MRKSIQWRLVTIYLLLVWLAMSIIGVYIIETEKRYQMQNMTSLMTSKAESLAMILKDKMAGAQDISEQINLWFLSQNKQIRVVYVYNTAEIPVAQEGDIVTYLPNGQHVANALKGESYIDDDDANDYKKNYKTIAIPITSSGGEVQGAIYMIGDMSMVDESLNNIRSILSTATLWALGVTVVLGSLLARTITEPIKAVTTKAKSLAEGDFDQTIPVHSNDEIGQLTEMFNFMSGRLKDTLDEMFREKSKIETILIQMTDGIIAVSTGGSIIHANPAALGFLTLTQSDTASMTFDEISDSISLDFHTKDLFGESKRELKNSLFLLGDKTLRLNIGPYSNERNEVAGAIIVIQDVTDQQKLDRMRKEFVANVSHELRTPLTTIKTYTETLLDGAMESQELTKKFLSVIDSESDRMTRLVKDLLQLSKIDYDNTKWKMQEMDVKEVIGRCVENLRIPAKQKEQTLLLKTEGEVASKIVGDRDKIAQVIINIVGNAMKYTPENGVIRVVLTCDDTYIIIKVIDNGIGIPEEDLPRLFERFYRVDKARSRSMGGTGLGLSIAKEIVEAHMGEIDVASEWGKGTEVTIKLKRAL